MDKHSELSLFVRVVEQGGFSAVARQLSLTPSAVSKQIARLESRLGVRLFNRTTRRLVLTEAGQTFYDHCVHIVADIEAAEESVRTLSGAVRGTLRLSGTVAFSKTQILPRLASFLTQYPDLSVEFELTDRRVDLIEEGLDAAVRFSEQVEVSSLVARRIADNRRVICAAPGYLETNGTPRTPEDLLSHNCLTLTTVSRFNEWIFKTEGREQTIRVGGNFKTNSADSLHRAVLSGIGLARLSTWLVGDDLDSGRLVRVFPQYVSEEAAIYLLYPHRRQLPPKVRAFQNFLLDQFTPVPPWEQNAKTR
jgi:DNA-binding transcriptional LysR family regulator